MEAPSFAILLRPSLGGEFARCSHQVSETVGDQLGNAGGNMKRTILLLAGLGFAAPAFAAPAVPVKCGANMERVWVYDDLSSLDVSARLKCGTPVDVIGLEKGYVKVRTADGNEGYVPADAIPSSELTVLTTAAAAASPVPTPASAAQANRQQYTVAAQPIAQPVPQQVAQMVPAHDVAPMMAANRVSAAPAPAPAPVPAPAVVSAPAPAPVVNVVPSPPTAPAPATPPAQQSNPAPSYVPAPIPAPAPSALPATHATAAPVTQPHVVAAKSAPAPKPAPVVPAPQPVATVAMVTPRPVTAGTSAVASQRQAPREEATLTIGPVSEPAPAAAPMPMATVVKAADVTSSTNLLAVRKAEYSDDDESLPQTAAPAADLASCSVYFSAYGVTPMQDKWIAGDLRKKFPGVCPAPEPSLVDYVVIFTHDMDFFTTTLPDPIHTDRNGFSDWSPVTAVDSTAIPISELDKAHREYAWVFRVHRGSFDPSKFTSRRRPQFTKAESSFHASSRTIEDAMQFISETGASSAQ
jgi:hypothetical protein